MKFSSRGTVLSTKNHFKSNCSGGPICKEYTITPKNELHYKFALLFVLITSIVHNFIFVEFEDVFNKCCVFIILIGPIIYITANLSSIVEKESLLLVVPLTLQITTTYIFGNETTTSLPWQSLDDLMIMEVIMGQRVHYFLSIVTNDNDKELNHVILFRNSKPPFKCLEIIYKDIQTIIDNSR